MCCVEGGTLAAAALDAVVARCPPVGIGVVMYLSIPKPKNWQPRPHREMHGNGSEMDSYSDEYACPDNPRLVWQKCFIPITAVGDRVFVTKYYRMTRSITPQSKNDDEVCVWLATTTERITEVVPFTKVNRRQLTEPKEHSMRLGTGAGGRRVRIKIEFRLWEVAFFAETEEGQQAEELQAV
ncbi:hypothetical protein HK097_010658 [Rhizophlyctis rosea]|uniref:Uncharacterized protein n=1 Tax=Rhizophlyctis rosea TaxID=64517 RepID=A0AAD5S7A9_9FUNG|nr:hypothetical protein HK097_010658 [Rhizophlyctis rosea]